MSTFLGFNSSRSGLRRILQTASRCRIIEPPSTAAARCLSIWNFDRARAHSRPSITTAQLRETRPSCIIQHRRSLFSINNPIIIHYMEIPPDYKDETGLSYRKGELETAEVVAIFGLNMDSKKADKLLRIMHGRRVAGTLDDPNFYENTAEFGPQEIKKALAYLRKTVEVDEVINAGLRAEDELRELERGEEEEEEEEEIEKVESKKEGLEKEKSKSTENVYGTGFLDQIRARNTAKRETEEKRLAEERKKQEEEDMKSNPGGLTKLEKNPPRQMSSKMQEYQKLGMLSDFEAPPEIPTLQRLLPMTAFAVLVMGACFAVSFLYTPPEQGSRILSGIQASHVTVATLLALNVAVFVAWHVPPLYAVMNRNFLLIPATPRVLSILGACFSHQKFVHLAVNLAFLGFFSNKLHEEAGRGTLLATYVGSGIFGFLCSHWRIVLTNSLQLTTLGCSGAAYGVMAAYFWAHRFEGFKIFGLPPDPYSGIQGLAFIAMMVAINIAGLRSRGNKDAVSHLGGLAYGVVLAEMTKRWKDAKAKEEEQQLKENRRKDEEKKSKAAEIIGHKDNWTYTGVSK